MRAVVFFAAFAVALVLITSCAESGGAEVGLGGRDQHAQAASWINRPASDRRAQFVKAIEHYSVMGPQLSESVLRLASVPHIVLSVHEAELLVGGTIHIEGTGIPVLLRMVEPESARLGDRSSDNVKVLWDSGDVLVKYLAVRSKNMPLRPAALVAIVPTQPSEVFVDSLTAIN